VVHALIVRPPQHAVSFVPASKFDLDAVARARAAGYPEIGPVLPALLEWLQDGNWPVAGALVDVLALVGTPIGPHIVGILRGSDDIWKYWVLTMLAPRLSVDAREAIIDECVRIINSPTDGERLEEVDLAARDILILHSHDS
jgi:hypothetical protein